MGTNLADALTRWLPAQRWFSGRQPQKVTIARQILLAAGDPALRHLIVTVGDAQTARYQVVIGERRRLPDSLRHAQIGPTIGGWTAYDAAADPELRTTLLGLILDDAEADGVRFTREPGASVVPSAPSRLLSAEQSNTSVIYADAAILKIFRRLYPGPNPDLEITVALAAIGSRHVALPYGRIETELDGQYILLAVLSEYLADSADGWSLALGSLRDGRSFTAEARELGVATAELHADLAAAFGTRPLTRAEYADLADRMNRKLDRALAEIPGLRPHEAKLRTAYAAAAKVSAAVITAQRIHGDYHLGQVLRTGPGWVVLDFEGEPLVPLAERRAPAPVLRDVAGMLRSFDYAAHQPSVRADGRVPLGLDEPGRPYASQWATRCQDAFIAGYAAGGGQYSDTHAPLLRALMFEKAVYEAVYEARHRPDWLSIPLDTLARA